MLGISFAIYSSLLFYNMRVSSRVPYHYLGNQYEAMDCVINETVEIDVYFYRMEKIITICFVDYD